MAKFNINNIAVPDTPKLRPHNLEKPLLAEPRERRISIFRNFAGPCTPLLLQNPDVPTRCGCPCPLISFGPQVPGLKESLSTDRDHRPTALKNNHIAVLIEPDQIIWQVIMGRNFFECMLERLQFSPGTGSPQKLVETNLK
jgi:hypothetical protein